MRVLIRSLGTVAIVSGLSLCPPAFAQHQHEAAGHSHDRVEAHGGAATMTKEFHFETVFHRDAVMIYLYDGSQGPLDAKGLTGAVEIQFRDKSRESLQANLEYVPVESGGLGYLRASLDLKGIADQEAKATVDIHGLPGDDEKDVSYRETFRLAQDQEEDQGHDDGHGHH